MKARFSDNFRVLGITPSSRGFAFAVLEARGKLVDWGVKSNKGERSNPKAIEKVTELIDHYRIGAIVLKDYSSKHTVRTARIQELRQEIITAAESLGVKAILLSPQKVTKAFFQNGQGTKHDLALLIASRFPQELGARMPPKRRPWMSEDSRMSIFDAVGLGMTVTLHSGR